ncbi:MAG: ATP-binding protein, partial [bacterium]
ASDIEFAAASNGFEEMSRDERLTEVLNLLQVRSPAFLDLGVFDEEGKHVAYVGPYNLEGKNYARAEWFRAVQNKSIYVSDVFLGYRNIPHFIIAVRKEESGRAWYLRATIDTHFFNSLVESIRVGKTGEAYLINKGGVFQTRRRSGGELMELDPDNSLYQSDEKDIVSFSAKDNSGSGYLYATGRLRETGWLLVVRQNINEAYMPLVHAIIAAVLIIVAGGAVVVVIAFLLASNLANRLTVADMEKREMRSQLIIAGKLAEVGEMSAGVAHEINNPLQIMMSEQTMINDILKDVLPDKSINTDNLNLLKDSVDQVSLQINRCKQITRGLLKFARKSETSIREVNLKELIHEVVGMIEHQAQLDGIRIIQKFEPDIPEIKSDPAQLQQVFLNLLNNAVYALKDKEGGEIRVAVATENDTLLVSVADNGCGIKPDVLEKIFMPFFTTKPVGKGTGLGLSTCYGIVERLGGQITVISEVNAGTNFTVRLPLSGSQGAIGTDRRFSEKGGEKT